MAAVSELLLVGLGCEETPLVMIGGDGWAVFVVPATFLAEGRYGVAMLCASHYLLPPGFKPFRRPCCSVAVAVCHGALVVPSGASPAAMRLSSSFFKDLIVFPNQC